jgi:hypothetical protein
MVQSCQEKYLPGDPKILKVEEMFRENNLKPEEKYPPQI